MIENKDLILNLCLQIKIMLREIKDEEDSCNEGSLSMYYNNIIDLLIIIENERLLQLREGNKK